MVIVVENLYRGTSSYAYSVRTIEVVLLSLSTRPARPPGPALVFAVSSLLLDGRGFL